MGAPAILVQPVAASALAVELPDVPPLAVLPVSAQAIEIVPIAGSVAIELNIVARGAAALPFEMVVAASDESTAVSAGTGKVTFRMPRAVTLTEVRASLSIAQASGSIFTVDLNKGGTSVLSTKLTIDNMERTSTTAAAPPVISDAAIAADAEMSVDVDQVGDSTAKGLKLTLIGVYA